MRYSSFFPTLTFLPEGVACLSKTCLSRRSGLLIVTFSSSSSSLVGSSKRRLPIVVSIDTCLFFVDQFGTLCCRDCRSSSSFILASKSVIRNFVSGFSSIELKIAFLIVFLISFWYIGSSEHFAHIFVFIQFWGDEGGGWSNKEVCIR